jgi:hypothetical protein
MKQRNASWHAIKDEKKGKKSVSVSNATRVQLHGPLMCTAYCNTAMRVTHSIGTLESWFSTGTLYMAIKVGGVQNFVIFWDTVKSVIHWGIQKPVLLPRHSTVPKRSTSLFWQSSAFTALRYSNCSRTLR